MGEREKQNGICRGQEEVKAVRNELKVVGSLTPWGHGDVWAWAMVLQQLRSVLMSMGG